LVLAEALSQPGLSNDGADFLSRHLIPDREDYAAADGESRPSIPDREFSAKMSEKWLDYSRSGILSRYGVAVISLAMRPPAGV